MRILYIIDRGILGGIQRHVQCLANCLCKEHEVAICIVGDLGPLGEQLQNEGLRLFALHGRNGHDFAILPRFEKMIREFRPDVIHGHVMPILGSFWLRFFHREIPFVISLHTCPSKPNPMSPAYLLGPLLRKPDYLLPVSRSTWEACLRWHPKSVGEVFYNPVIVDETDVARKAVEACHVVGMVGRGDPAKGWAEFSKIAGTFVGRAEVWGVGVSEAEAQAMLGATADRVKWMGLRQNGREWIAKMDLFLMTSRHEEMPTVVLECFAERTPICGFVPDGGTSEILEYSNGPLREAFIEERDCKKLAEIAHRILDDADFRNALIEDGWRVVNEKFNAMRNCRGRLIDIYENVVREKRGLP